MAIFAHIADTHIRNLRYHKEYSEVFATMVEKLREEKVDYIVHCGDIAHSKTQISPEFVNLCSEFLTGLASVAPTYIILGNHDGNLKNSTREDAISPIVSALKLPNLHLLKNSGECRIDEEYSLNVLSVFDRSNWVNPSTDSLINIALYHGSISHCKTDLGWVMEHGEDEISIFDRHDFAFLGDIHKTNQTLDEEGRIRYAGSTVQQNFGETNDKGFLVWDIKSKNDFTVKHVSIPNPKPFITIKLTKAGRIPKNTKCPSGARLRLVSENNLPLHTMKRAMDVAQHRFKPERITYLNRAAGERGNVEEQTSNLAIDNLRDPSVQEELIQEYLKDYNPTNEQLEKVYELNKKYNTFVQNNEEVQRNVNWKLSKMSWNNLFNYGEKNSINFDNLNGIVGVFGKNYSGKSSVVDSFLYTVFNSTSKNERKNLNIINQNKPDADGEVFIEIGDKEYHIHRQSEKYVKKLKGEEFLEAKTGVNFSVKDLVTGETSELNGLTRNETDKIIRNYFGSMDDFLLTSMSSQLGALQFIGEGSTKRKEILAKFLDLETFDKKFKLAKDDVTDLRGALKRLDGKEFDEDILVATKELMLNETETQEHSALCESIKKELDQIQENTREIQKSIDSIPTEIIDIKEVESSISKKEKEAASLTADIIEAQENITEKEDLVLKIGKFINEFDVEDLRNKKEIIAEKTELLEKISKEIEDAKRDAKNKNAKIQLLKEVPCGNQFPNCKFICDAHSASAEIPDLVSRVQTLNENYNICETEVKKLNPDQVEDHLNKYQEIIDKKENCAREIDTMRLRIENSEITLKSLEKDIEALSVKKDLYYENKDVIENKESFVKDMIKEKKSHLAKEKQLEKCQQRLLELYKEHGSLEQKLKSLEDQKQELVDLREEYSAYDLFMRCMHPNGIAYDIIKKQLPIINEEIAKILTNIVEFEVFFEADNKSLNIFIKHPKHDQRPLDMGSGAEKTLAAMAIRLALLSVSSLPKSDIFILDEPGTALDVDNMDGFISILELIKTYFKTVILISHLDSLKDCVDQQIVIDKKKGFAHVAV